MAITDFSFSFRQLQDTEVPTPVSYTMRAYNTSTVQYVYWTVEGSPDLTGSDSPFNPANLDNIVVSRVNSPSDLGQSLVPVAMNEVVDGSLGSKSLGAFSWNPLDWRAGARFSVQVVLSSSNSAETASINLYNLSDQELVGGATLGTTSLSPVVLETSPLTVGSSIGNLKNSQKIYEVRLSTSSTLAGDLSLLEVAYLRVF